MSVFIIAQLLENASPKTKGHRLWAVPFSVPPGWGQDFCKRQINYMALCLQALPTALHHVKPRSGGEGVPAGANPPAGRVCQRMLTHPGKGYSYLPPSAASDSRHSLSQRTTLRRGAPGRVCLRPLGRRGGSKWRLVRSVKSPPTTWQGVFLPSALCCFRLQAQPESAHNP